MKKPLLILLACVVLIGFGSCLGSAGTIVVGGLAVFVGPKVIALTASGDEEEEVDIDDEPKVPGDPRCREDVPHCMKVREARANIAPFDDDILDYATKAYNKHVPSHVPWAKRCSTRKADFERIERKTLYPIAMIIGIASHESAGCQMISATNGDGGTGYMQVTRAPVEFKRRAASMLGLTSVKELNLNDPVHNVAVGMVIWDDCEVHTLRRDLAALCYNRGIGAVNAVAPWAGDRSWKRGKPYPHFVAVYPYINTKVYPSLGPTAKRYTGEVLAHMVMVGKVLRGEEPKDIPSGQLLTLNDIPGWNPEDDGNAFVTSLIAAEE